MWESCYLSQFAYHPDRNDMEGLFDPVIKDVLRLVHQQVTIARTMKKKRINVSEYT